MIHRIGAENFRTIEQNQRSLAEAVLGNEYTVRVYAKHGNMARGTVMLCLDGACTVHTAYMLCGCENMGSMVSGIAVGVIVDTASKDVSIMLDATGKPTEYWLQHRIAESVDFWECGRQLKIYCLREKSCGAVVYTTENGERKYLIIRMNLGHCGLPKGHMEKFESEECTAKREVLEETGVNITLLEGFRQSVSYSLTPRTEKETVYFLGSFDGDTVKIQEAEVSSYYLLGYESARRRITYENDRLILDAAEEMLRSLEN